MLLYVEKKSSQEQIYQFAKEVDAKWLEPSDKGTPEEQEEVLRMLWNFSVDQEAEEERINDENGWAMP